MSITLYCQGSFIKHDFFLSNEASTNRTTKGYYKEERQQTKGKAKETKILNLSLYNT